MATLIEDSRQQSGKHELKHEFFSAHKIPFIRCKLPVGDYALPPRRAVDTKASMSEIAQNIGGGKAEHNRFINELKLAKQIGCELYVLIENEERINTIEDVRRWHNPRLEYSPKAITGERLAKAMHTIQERYGCTFMFCRPEESAEIIIDLLTAREL